jgi:hypothetical protein
MDRWECAAFADWLEKAWPESVKNRPGVVANRRYFTPLKKPFFKSSGRGRLQLLPVWFAHERKSMNPPPSRTASAPSLKGSERQSQGRAGAAGVLPAHALLWHAEDTTPVRMRRPDRLPPAPAGRGPARNLGAGAGVLKACHALDVPVVARGAGTGLSGGAMPHALGVTLSLAKFNASSSSTRPAARPSCSAACATSRSAKRPRRYGLYYAPDPSSQIACTIGGNVAENSGGVHCLKYGLTVHNVLKVRASRSKAKRSSSAAMRSMRPATTC